MAVPAIPTCPSCGARLVLEMDPGAPLDSEASVLLADPPFGLVCASPGCSLSGRALRS